MSESSEHREEITALLRAHGEGDSAALDHLIPLVYADLQRIARRHLQNERADHTLNTTAVVHEAYLRLVDQAQAGWQDRAHFFAFASRVMRNILIDWARKRGRQKRGNGLLRVPIEGVALGVSDPTTELLALDEALTQLTLRDERMGRVVECRLFGGMTTKEIAGALQVSLSTIERDWRCAKAYLYQALFPG